MNNICKSLLTIAAVLSVSQVSFAQGQSCDSNENQKQANPPQTPKPTPSPRPTPAPLTAAQCTELNGELTTYVAAVDSFLTHKLITSAQAQAAISDAQAEVNKLCPVAAAPTEVYECLVNTPTGNEPIGTSSSGGLVDTATQFQTVCMTQNACQNIVSQAFQVVSATSSAACSQSGAQTIIQMTDAQVQTAVTAILNP